MASRSHLHPADIRGLARLAADATTAVTDVVEAMHEGIASPPFLRTRGVPGGFGASALVYASVRGITRLAGGGLDLALTPILPLLGERASTPERDTLLSVLCGVVGDHLSDTGNPLAIRMQLRRSGRALALERRSIAASLPRATSKLAVLLHGLCGTDGQWKRAGFDYGAALERDHGFTPLYLRYNSGRHVSTNGRELDGLLEALLDAWPLPIEDILLVGHSMGGLVARSALHYASGQGRRWRLRVRRAAFLGTPHHGAPLERGGHGFEQLLGSIPFAAPMSRLGRLRSAGITDLRHGNLLDEDWHDCDRFAHASDRRLPVPLPPDVDCLAVAATTGAGRGDPRDRLVGDGLVPVASALGHHRDPQRHLAFENRHVVYRSGHMSLLGHAEVWESLSGWLAR